VTGDVVELLAGDLTTEHLNHRITVLSGASVIVGTLQHVRQVYGTRNTYATISTEAEPLGRIYVLQRGRTRVRIHPHTEGPRHD